MTTNVNERTDLIISIADDNDGLVSDAVNEKIAALRPLAVVANIEPGLEEYALHFLLENLGIPVKTLLERVSRLLAGD